MATKLYRPTWSGQRWFTVQLDVTSQWCRMKGILYSIQVIVIIVEQQLILRHRPISAICIHIYVAIVSYAEECNYCLWLTHVRWYVQPCTHLVLQGIILEWDQDCRHRVGEASGAVQSTPWDNWVQMLAEITTYAEKYYYAYISNSSTYTWSFSYMCLHEAMPTNYAVMHKAYTVQLHIPSYCKNLRSQGCNKSGKWGYQLTGSINCVDLLCAYISPIIVNLP